MLIIKPAKVIVFGAHVLGICSTSHLQNTCIQGSQMEIPEALYLCSFNLFNWPLDKYCAAILSQSTNNKLFYR